MMSPMPHRLIALLALGALLPACTDAQLTARPPEQVVPKDNKLSVHTTVCLNTPDEVLFPVKVIFAIDTSSSMDVSDPVDPMQPDPTLATGRARAISEVVDKFKDTPGFDVAIVKFGASANVVTNCPMAGPCFIPDTTANTGALK